MSEPTYVLLQKYRIGKLDEEGKALLLDRMVGFYDEINGFVEGYKTTIQ
jgi:hypothetical protein